MNSIKGTLSQIKMLEGAIGQIYGSSDTGADLLSLCETARIDIEDIHSQRGIKGIVISVIGAKNTGKSTLCKSFVTDPTIKNSIKSGVGSEDLTATRKVTWIGKEKPVNFDKALEMHINLSEGSMIDLGVAYTLADVPSMTDSDASARIAAKKAQKTANVCLVTFTIETLEDDASIQYLKHLNGATIIPVVTSNYTGSDEDYRERLEKNLKKLQDRITRHVPRSDVHSPVVVGRLDAFIDPQERDRQEQKNVGVVQPVIANVIKDLKVNLVAKALRRKEVLWGDLRRELADFLENVEPSYRDLKKQETKVVEEICIRLIGVSSQTKAAIRVKMLNTAVSKCWPILFPFKSFLGLLALASGAWSRLVLAAFGSAPSLVMAAVQSGKNIKSLKGGNKQGSEELELSAKSLAHEYLSTANLKFVKSIHGSIPREAKSQFQYTPSDTKIEGLAQLSSNVKQNFESAIDRCMPKMRLIILSGVVSVVLAVGLAFGPLYAVYHEFIAAWVGAMEGPAEKQWANFPVPSFGMIASTLFLICIPIFLLALISLACTVTHRVVTDCSEMFEDETSITIKRFVSNRLLYLDTDDDLRDAAVVIMDSLSKEN